MIYIWTKPDGTRVRIESSAPIRAALDDLNARLQALGPGKRLAAATLAAAYESQLVEWRQCERASSETALAEVRELITMLAKRLAWWREYATQGEISGELSAAQRAIFADLEESVYPRSWEHAARALNMLDEYRLPPRPDLPAAIRASQICLEEARQAEHVLSELIDDLRVGVPTSETWDGYREAIQTLDEAARRAQA